MFPITEQQFREWKGTCEGRCPLEQAVWDIKGDEITVSEWVWYSRDQRVVNTLPNWAGPIVAKADLRAVDADGDWDGLTAADVL